MTEKIIGMERFDDIVAGILKEAKQKVEEIISKAKEQADAMIAEAERKVEEQVKQRLAKLLASVEEEGRRRISEAKLEARRIILQAKEEAIMRVFDEVTTKLKEIVEKPEYAKILEKLICEAGEALGGGELVATLNERDANIKIDWEGIAKKIESKVGRETKIQGTYGKVSDIGGVIVSTADGKFTFDNTFEGRMKRMEKKLRLIASNVLLRG
ncbi:MAG: V-type proton ATPase subunit E [archaeon GB-1867-005]|nr:V-type proton ATPase subunit E [Candidatus Culexmicrobium cathedralense]